MLPANSVLSAVGTVINYFFQLFILGGNAGVGNPCVTFGFCNTQVTMARNRFFPFSSRTACPVELQQILCFLCLELLPDFFQLFM